MNNPSTRDRKSWGSLARDFGVAGRDLTRLNAAEGAAGNLSVYGRWFTGVKGALPLKTVFDLPVPVPSLAGGWVIVTGSGCRLRDLKRDAKSNLCALRIHGDGVSATLYSARKLAPTSELNSHLAVHNDQVSAHDHAFHVVVHAQPRFLTYLSHHPVYQSTSELSRRLMRWEPETLLAFPEGIATIGFAVPGSQELMRATVDALRDHRIVVWQRHGVVTRSDASLQKAADLVEYSEAAAHFEYLNLQVGEASQGISPAEMKELRDAWKLPSGDTDA